MRLMFPHKIDRYRIIQKLVRMERRRYNTDNGLKGINQNVLANKARVSQAAISNLENLETSLEYPKRTVSRQELIKILTSGMRLEQKKVDAILWLYDGAVPEKTEIYEYVKEYLPDASPGNYDYNYLRNYVLELLTKVFKTLVSENTRDATAKNIFTQDEDTLVRSIETLCEVEKIPGYSIMVTKHPPFLVRPVNTLKVKDRMSKMIWEKMFALHEERRKVFFNYVEHYGYRSIHQKSCIEMYLGNDHPYRNINLDERRAHIREWIKLLKSCPDYEVGLAETVSDTEIFNKCNKAVMVRGTPFNIYPDLDNNPFTGLRFIQYMDEISTLHFFLECEYLWNNIVVENRTKDSVIGRLESLIRES